MRPASAALCLFLPACVFTAAASASEITVYTSRAAFLAAVTGATNLDLGAPRTIPTRVTIGTTYFVTSTSLTVVDRTYCCTAYNRGATSIAAPDFGIGANSSAIGFEVFTVATGNPNGTNQDVIDVQIEGIKYHFLTAPAPNTVFLGFITTDLDMAAVYVTNSAGRQIDLQNVVVGPAIRGAAKPPAPFGSVDTPLRTALTNLSGAIGVTGWALSTNSVATIGVWREPVAGEIGTLLFVGNASIIPGVRPDVAGAYPAYPNNTFGWGLQLLTNQLPGGIAQPPGNGAYKLHVIATNPEGGSTDLAGPIAITVNNAAASVPFGTIDTPGPGAIVSGTAYVNFGWALTPNPALIPKDGSTITVLIDNQSVGHPVYNNNRSDIATLFPGLQNSAGAIGYYTIDTTKLSNGIHSISWAVTDSAGHAQGLGSRYFFVQN